MGGIKTARRPYGVDPIRARTRCVVNWRGDWSNKALAQVGHEFTATMDMDDASYAAPKDAEAVDMLRVGVLPVVKSSGR